MVPHVTLGPAIYLVVVFAYIKIMCMNFGVCIIMLMEIVGVRYGNIFIWGFGYESAFGVEVIKV